MIKNRFSLFYIIAALLAIAAQYGVADGLYVLIKPIPALLCLWLAYGNFKSVGSTQKAGRLLIAAFVFCALGDIILALEKTFVEASQLFLWGMASFALAHLCFIGTMTVGVPVSNINAPRHWGQLATATLLLVFGVEFFIINRESFGELKLAILAYSIILVTMAITASLRMLYHGKKSYLSVLSGAVLFLVSDALLAVIRFTDHMDVATFFVLPTYFAAIGLMSYGYSIGNMAEELSGSKAGGEPEIDRSGA